MRVPLDQGVAGTVVRTSQGLLINQAENLSRVAFALESKGKSKELDGADEIVNGLEKELAALTRYVQENFSKHGEL